MPVSVQTKTGDKTGELIATTDLEVQSRKLGYRDDYRWMLRDIIEFGGDLVLQSFASTQQRFRPGATMDPAAAYARFEFLRSIASEEELGAALSEVTRQPHQAWVPEAETTPTTRGFPIGSRAVANCRVPV